MKQKQYSKKFLYQNLLLNEKEIKNSFHSSTMYLHEKPLLSVAGIKTRCLPQQEMKTAFHLAITSL